MIQIFIALLLFVFFALSGMVSDLGFARLAQRQMSVSAESAALEGLRFKDALADVDRRNAARTLLRDHFDDDFRRTAADPYQYGAGPDVTFAGGQTNMAANQQVVVGPGLVYKPDPELNLANVRHGDMVSGFFDENAIPAQGIYWENQAYARTDFSLVPPAGASREAFLVRVRRTNNDLGLDSQPGVSSSGAPLPYLFSRGSMMAGPLRTRGVTVRGTGIAAARPVTAAGIPYPSINMLGVAPFGFEYDFWLSQANATSFTVVVTLNEGNNGNGNNGNGNNGNGNNGNGNNGNGNNGNGNNGNGNNGNGNPVGGPPIIPPGQIQGGGPEPVVTFLYQGPPTAVGSHEYLTGRRMWSIGDEVPTDPFGNPDTIAASIALTEYLVPIYEGDILTYDGRPGNSNPPFLPPVNNIPKDDMPPRIVGFGLARITNVQVIDPNSGNSGTAPRRIEVTLMKFPGNVHPSNVSAVATPGLAGLPQDMARLVTNLNLAFDQAGVSMRAAALVR